jgi:hypothetical protein
MAAVGASVRPWLSELASDHAAMRCAELRAGPVQWLALNAACAEAAVIRGGSSGDSTSIF